MEVNEDGTIDALTMGRTASFYYLKHESMHVFRRGLCAGMGVPEVRTCLHALLAAHLIGPQCSLSARSVSIPAPAGVMSSREAFHSLSSVELRTAHPIGLPGRCWMCCVLWRSMMSCRCATTRTS